MSIKFEKEKILGLLNRAEQLVGQFSGGHSGNFLSAEEFHAALLQSIIRYKSGDNQQIEILSGWFLPTSTWDDFVGVEGQNLGNDISELLWVMKDSLK